MAGDNGVKQITNGEAERAISIKAADKWIAKAEVQLKAEKIRARAKVGKFVEQEGEHHQARTMIADAYEDLIRYRAMCEEKLALAKESNNDKEIKFWMKWLLLAISEINATAKNMNLTRRKVDPNESGGPSKVPTMPARTEITNNTQVIVGVASKP